MMIHLEIYVVDQANVMQAVWRRTLFDVDTLPPVGAQYMLFTKDAQKWLFPESSAVKGEHYDSRLEVWVVWMQMTQTEPVSFENFSFALMDRSRWPG